MTIFCFLNFDKNSVNVNAFIDFNTISIHFMNFKFARFQQFFLFILLRSRILEIFDDNFIIFEKIIYVVRTFLHIEEH